MSLCVLCGSKVDDRRLLSHWCDECPKPPFVPPPAEPPLLARVWDQINTILVEQRFAR